jgi:hypothetical protein
MAASYMNGCHTTSSEESKLHALLKALSKIGVCCVLCVCRVQRSLFMMMVVVMAFTDCE